MASIQRTYPHVSEITDPAVAKSLRLLWDLTYAHAESLQSVSQVIAAQGTTLQTIATRAQITGTAVATKQNQG